jgi:hypothetical protein
MQSLIFSACEASAANLWPGGRYVTVDLGNSLKWSGWKTALESA